MLHHFHDNPELPVPQTSEGRVAGSVSSCPQSWHVSKRTYAEIFKWQCAAARMSSGVWQFFKRWTIQCKIGWKGKHFDFVQSVTPDASNEEDLLYTSLDALSFCLQRCTPACALYIRNASYRTPLIFLSANARADAGGAADMPPPQPTLSLRWSLHRCIPAELSMNP